MRCPRWGVFGALLAALSAAPALGQSVRGTVLRDGVRVDGAVVMLLDSAGAVVARGVSREHGDYALAAPRAGRYTLRVLRIGWAPTLAGPVALPPGAPTSLDLTLTGAPVRIAGLRIVDRAPCEVRPDSDAVAFRLWEEARKALLAASLTEQEHLTMRTTSIQRVLEATSDRVLAESSQVHVVPTVKPFVSLPADSLAAGGYVQRTADGDMVFWAPDADVLLSESFAMSHCLRAERAATDTGAASRWMGIAFQPSGAPRGVGDVEGVLWLDAGSAELRRLDYRYVHLGEIDRPAREARAGGRVEFLRLPTGGWIIPRWEIRYPVLRTVTRGRPSVIPGVRRELPTARVELAEVRVTGGEVSAVQRGTRVIWERGRIAFRVLVADAERGRPVPGSVVSLDGSPDTAVTGADGVALLARVLPGAHRLMLRTATTDLLGVAPVPVNLAVPETQTEPRRVTMPSERALLAQACGARVAARHEALLRGAVRASVLPLPDARVSASWQASFERLGGGAPVVVARRIEATSNARGEFVMCGLPRGLPISLRVARATGGDRAVTFTIPPAVVAVEQRLIVEP